MDKGSTYTMEWCLKRDWIDALRSGKYRQTQNAYADFINERVSYYCCLGVERVLAVGKWDNVTPYEAGDMSFECQGSCIRLNDDEGRDFLYIADWIEDNIRAVLK
jgi:hypothetical protein